MTDLGAVALTSSEVVSNAVPAFEPTGGAERPDRDRALSVDLAQGAVEMATTAGFIAPIRIREGSRVGFLMTSRGTTLD